MNYFYSLSKVLNHPLNRPQKVKTVARIIWWKCNQWFFHLPAKVTLTEEISLLCYPETAFGSYVVYARWPEYAETKFLLNYLRSTDVFFDVGAHLGELSLLAASKITRGTVVAFEPTPTTLTYLRENLKLNDVGRRITVIEKAVSSKVGRARFVLSKESEVNHLKSISDKNSKSITVPTTTIDREMQRHKLKQISFLKVDVEGAELTVLEGAKTSLKEGKIEVMMLEINPKSAKYHQQSLFTFLQGYNYTYYSFNDDGTLSLLTHLDIPASTINILAVKTNLIRKRLKPYIKK